MNSGDYPERRRLTRAEAKAQTRERLVEAARSVFARRGFAGASVDEIADTAGYTIGALYSNFDNKEQLFVEVMSRHAERRLADAVAAVQDSVASGDDVGAAVGRLVIDVADKDLDYAPLQAEFWLYAIRNPELADRLAKRSDRIHAVLKPLIQAGLDDHNAAQSADADAAATIVIALFQGLVQQRRINPAAVSEQLYGQALAWLFTGIAATPPPPPSRP